MNRTLLNPNRIVLSIWHVFPVILFTLVSFSLKAQCPPTVVSIPATANVCAGDSVTMTASPSTGATWQWYKDGILLPGKTNSTFYAVDAGKYTVITGGCATVSDPISVTLRPLPVVSLTASSTTICYGQDATLFVTAGPAVIWAWIQPAPIFGTKTNPLHVTLTKTQTYQLVGADQTTQCASTRDVTITVLPILTPPIISANSQVCPGGTPPLITSTLPAGATGTYTYQWQVSTTSSSSGFNDIPGATGPTYQPGPAVQTTWYRIKISSPPCDDQFTNSVVVQVNQNPAVTSASVKTICTVDNVNYNPTSIVAGTTFTWTASLTSGTVTGFTASGTGKINDILSLPFGSSSPGEVTYVITPTGPAPTNCPGLPKSLVVTVQPMPLVTNAPLSQTICSGTTTAAVNLQSNIASTTFTWTATGTGGLSGYPASGTGNIPAMQINGTLSVPGTVNITIVPHGAAGVCSTGPSVLYVITVNPSPSVTNNPMQQNICTGNSTSLVNLTSNVPATTFTWTATASPAGVAGYQASGTNSIPVQTLTNSTNVQGKVTYIIVPNMSVNGCAGIAKDYIVNVNPKPIASVTQSTVTICSGTLTNIPLFSNIAGTTFSWTSSGPGVLSGHSAGTGTVISQLLTNTSNAPHPVTYVVTPEINGCPGDPITVTVIVNPTQVLTVVPSSPTTCSGNSLTINLIGNVAGITFAWTASTTGNVTGFSDGSGSIITQTLVNNDNVSHTVLYAVTMTLNGCTSSPANFTATVYPVPSITNSPLVSAQCSGAVFNLANSSSVSGSSFSWIANSSPGITGASNGTGNTINQIVFNNSNAPASVVYTITPTADGCPGTPSNYTLTVNPVPVAALSLSSQAICSGTSTVAVNLSSNVTGTTFTWTATPSGAGITGYTASGSALIPSQILTNTLTTQGTVTYAVRPSFSGCNGNIVSHIVTINPLPVVSNPSMSQTICSGASSANVNLQSNVAGTSFTWTASASSASVTGFLASGTNTIPSQTIFNSLLIQGNVKYQIIPTSNLGPNCPGTPATYTINVNPSPAITSSLTDAICSGLSYNYTITTNIPGSTFTWTRAAVTGISNSPASGLSATINETLVNTTTSDIDVKYILIPTGQAPSLCSGTPQTLVVKVRALPQVNAGPDVSIANGTFTSLNGSASGGTGLLAYSWTPISYISSGAATLTPQTINLGSNRSYTLLVTDAAGCSASDQMTVNITGDPLAVAPTSSPTTICSGLNAVIDANATGGSGSYTYSWTSVPAGYSSTSSSITVLPLVNTVYFVAVNDGFNTTTSSVAVTVNPLPLQYGLTGGGSYCIGGSGVVLGLAGSQSGVNYQLLNNGNPAGLAVPGNGASVSFGNQTLTGLYTVSASRISTGCVQSMGSSVSVSINPLPVANAGPDQIIPFGTSTTLSGSVSGGTGTMSYSWIPSAFIASGVNTSSPSTTNIYTNASFTLAVTDAKGCTGTDNVAVSLTGNALNVNTIATPAQICADTSQTELNALATGGSGNYTYSWTSIPAGSPVWTSTLQNPKVSPDVNTIYTVTASDGFNSAIASATIIVNPMPLKFSVTGGGDYCYAGLGANVGLSGSEINTNYQLLRGGVVDGPAVTGTGNPISFGNRTAAFAYTVLATNNITGCTSLMNGNTTVTIQSPPLTFLMTGGGSYPFGGPGREIGLVHADVGISYQLYCNNIPVGLPLTGNETPLNFGLQKQAGTYTITATDMATGCTSEMTGSIDIKILPAPVMFDVTGGGTICKDEPGLRIGLTGSETGLDYQLLYNGFPKGAPVAGTNFPISWGPFANAGLYEVRAINFNTGVTRMMKDSAVIMVNPAPTIFSINPTGPQCPGTIIRLNGSEQGFTYYLQLNGIPVDTLAGTGVVGFLDFGPQTNNGTYTIRALNILTGCQAMMNGSTYISVAPQIFNVIPAGILCPGQNISLDGSEIGVNYQLRWNGIFDLGTPVAGTGSSIILGTVGLPGIYSAVAINATTNCVTYMNDSATLYPDPTAFTIVPDGAVCEGNQIGLNGSEQGVDYILLLDNAIHLDTIAGNGLPISFGPQFIDGNYTILAVDQVSYCQFPMNGNTVIKENPIQYTLLPAGIQCIGNTIALSGSQTGVSYQLMLNGLYNIGLPVKGTGGVISFGPQNLSGTYTVRAVNDVTGCNSIMADKTIFEPLPFEFTTILTGKHCAGTSIGLNGSQLNYNYILVLDGVINLDTIAGDGNAIDFGPMTTAGIYSITAYNSVSNCSAPMIGSTEILPLPIRFQITSAGLNCASANVGLNGSETGVYYTLYKNEISTGITIAGTGSKISFGIQADGSYTVRATNQSTTCSNMMEGPVLIGKLPVVNTGSDATICSTGAAVLNATVNLGGSTAWSTSGDGVFNNTNNLDAIYTPGVTDIANGSAYLFLTVNGTGNCTIMQVTDTLKITIDKPATANAGGNIEVCSKSDLTIYRASATNYSTVNWTSSGTGSLTGKNTMTPNYLPSELDLTAGYVTLTMHVRGNSPCSNETTSATTLSFHPFISVDAGPGARIGFTDKFTASTASVHNSATVLWSTSGSGTFNNSSLLKATYTPSLTDLQKGSVILSLTAFNMNPCGPAVDTLTLKFYNNSKVDFAWFPSCDAQPVAFTVNPEITNIGATASWLWNFGDGTSSSLMNPTHLFPALGGYMVTLTTKDTSGIVKTISHKITISQFPVSFFSSSIPNCSNELVNFTDLSHTLYGYIARWAWDYGDGSAVDSIQFPDEPNVSHKYDTPGSYNVTLSVTNSFGCATSATIPVEVIEAPVANFQYNDVCSGLETSFRDASYANGPGNKVQYWWDFGDPSTGTDNYSDKQDATHIFSAPGIYQVKHWTRNFNNCTDTIVKPVVILTPVPVDFVYDHICKDGITNFRPDSSVVDISSITGWEWNFGDGVINNQQNTTHVYAEPGSYQVTLTLQHESGCTATKTRTVIVNPLPVAMFNMTQIPCVNSLVHFEDVSTTYAGFITKWNWEFGDGNTMQILYPAKPDAEHSYSIPGTYTVKLTIFSSDGCTSEREQTIIVKPAPVANFDYANACQGTPVQFTDLTQSDGAGILSGWNWNFGDEASGNNNNSSIQNPEHTYTKTGTYQVSLTASSANGCSSFVVRTVVITVAPFVDFTYDSRCESASILFSPSATVNTGNVATWNWSFGDGTTSALSNPQHTYIVSGEYTVSFTIVNKNGCQNTISQIISVLPAPVARFSTNTPACSQKSVAFTNQSSVPAGYITRWEYDFGDGTNNNINYPENADVSHTYPTYGTYNATLTVVTINGCTASTSQSIQILSGPVANFDYDVSCMDVPVNFNDLSQGNLISRAWNFGDPGSASNNTSNQQNPSHTYQKAGNYLVSLYVGSANGCSDTITRTISISGKPVVDFSFNSGCSSDTVHFNSSEYIDFSSTSSWSWDFGDNATSADANPYHIYAARGTYTVSLTITNKNGCTNVRTRKIQVTASPTAKFTASSLSCSGTAVLFSDLSSTPNGIIESWNWNFDDGTAVTVNAPAIPDVSHIFGAPGIYEVTLTIRTSTGCYAYSASMIKINNAPVSAFRYTKNCNDGTTSFTDLSQSAGSKVIVRWNWNFGDPASGISNVSNQQNPQHRFSKAGTYKVVLTTENTDGCRNSSEQILIVNSEKDIDFNVSASCIGAPVAFSPDTNEIKISDVASCSWDFGDGTPGSDLAQTSHIFAGSGNYTVTLTLTTLMGCNFIVSKTITVHELPVAQFTNSGNCTGNQVAFKDNSFGPFGEKIVSWSWDFGVNTTTSDSSSLQNPFYTYTAPGTYNPRLNVTSASGCTASVSVPITVLAGPSALFSYVAESCHNGSVIFTDESASRFSQITGWNWEFAPGIYSTLQNPVHVFGGSDSCYNVKLVVSTANGCSSTLVERVCIPSGIKVAINSTQACFGEPTWFSPTLIEPSAGKITFYNWNFGDPATGYYNESKLETPQHAFSKAGTFVVSLHVTDINNCSATMYMSVVVDPLPISAFSYTGVTCDSLIKFTDMTNGAKIARWTWNFGDGKSKTINAPANPNVNHYYPTPGIYEVTLITHSLAGCSDTLRKTIRRTPCIRAAIAVKDPVVCQKRSMKFSEASTCEAPIASWQWFFGDNTSVTYTSQQPVVEHTYKVPGNYTVKMVVATQMVGGIATDTASSQVAVQPAAKAGYQWQDVCIGKSTLFDNLSQNNNTTIKSYQWNFGDPASSGNTTSVVSPDYKYNLAGEYNVKLVVTNTLGCTDTLVKKVNIFAGPAANFNWKNNCEGKPVYFADNSDTASSAIVNWNWKFTNAGAILDASTKRSCAISFPGAGVYNADLKVTDRNGCATNIAKEVTISANPVAAFKITENYENKEGRLLLTNGTLNGTDYEWDFGNGKTSSAPAPAITFDREGHYTIQLIAWNGASCSDTMKMEYALMFKGLYVPNAFNPGHMDPEVAIFKPKGTNLKSYSIQIFDRWGNQLWSSNKIDSKGSPAEAWDGTLHGELLKQDVYVWKISAQFNDGEVWEGKNAGNNKNLPQMKSGTITLIR